MTPPPLIGRDHPAGILRAEIDRATRSHGGLVLVTGEAGIGKTTLVTGAVEDARRQGALVLSGSCWDSASAPGYWPWVQVIRGLRRSATREEWAAAEAAAGSRLPVLLGEAAGPETPEGRPGGGAGTGPAAGPAADDGAAPGPGAGSGSGPGVGAGSGAAGGSGSGVWSEAGEGFELYDAVTTALVSVSHSRPVMVVLDDLHWSDTASLKLLEFAAHHTWFERLLLVGAYRDVEVESAAGHPLQPLMTPLLAKATTVTLTGLGRDEVGALMTRTVGEVPDAALVAEVHRRTGGNPFFVEQTARLWRSGGSLSAVAPGVRDAVRRRLSLLPEPVAGLLTTAAVLGREFPRPVLAAVAAAPVPHVDRLLDQAAAARLVTALGGGRFSFAHDLVRETLYESLGEDELRARHADVVRALDRAPALADRLLPADLARHAHLAGGALEPARAVDHLLAAARHASGRLAVEESIVQYRRALEAVGDSEPRRRIMIALDLGRELRHSGEAEDSWRVFEDAVAVSRRLDDPKLLARVALTLYGRNAPGDRARMTAGLLREAHGRLVGEGTAPDAGAPLDELAHQLTVRVTMLARQSRDDEELGFSLWTLHHAIWGLGSSAEREALTEEIMDVARRTADAEMESYAASFRWVALLEQGDARYLDQYQEFQAVAQRTDQPRTRFASCIDHCVIATLMGGFAEAAVQLDRAVQVFGAHEHEHFVYMSHHLRWALLLPQGRFEELDELHRSFGDADGREARLLEAITAVERGDLDAVVQHLSRTAGGAETYSREQAPLWLRFQAQAAAASRDPELCARARAGLAPYRGQWAVSLYGCDVSGPMDLWSALLDAAEERWDDAIAGFSSACRSAELLRARPWSVTARSHLARTLLDRGAPGDAEAAAVLMGEVESEAAELGMRHIVARVRRWRSAAAASAAAAAASGAGAGGDAAADGGTAADGGAGGGGTETGTGGQGTAGTGAGTAGRASTPAPAFRFDGQVWSLTFGSHSVHMPDAKGLRDLHVLLGSPGSDIPAVRLLAPEGGETVVAARRMGGDAVLDDTAKAAYKRRLDLLDEEIDRATELGDDRRAVEYDRERTALLGELRAAAGLAGRSRRLGDEAERARKTVTARIRDTLRKIDRLHPELGAFLRASVSTGSTCSYRPDRVTARRL